MEQTTMGIKSCSNMCNSFSIALFMLASLCLTSCTLLPPGDNLFEGLEAEIKPEELTENVYIVGFWKTQVECMGKAGVVSVLGFPILGCGLLYHNANGKGYWCDIYMMADWGWIYEHEHRHCLGYSDF